MPKKMAANKNTYETVLGNVTLSKEVEVKGVKVTCHLFHTYFKKSAVEIFESSPKDAETVRNLLGQMYYIPLTLPNELKNEQGINLLGQILPKFDILQELVNKVSSLNPHRRGAREGNSHQILVSESQSFSIGSILLYGAGIGQNHQSPSLGVAGSYHPHLALSKMYSAGYRAKVDTKSAMYLALAQKFAEREQELAKKLPAKKAKK